MQTIKHFLFLLLFPLLMGGNAVAQSNERLRISLITCTPGEELYSIFGHSALRIVDSNSVSDIIFNYGTFNFDDDGFYLKFMRGKLNYFVSVQTTADFLYGYQLESRGVTEQVLDLSDNEKFAFKLALINNLKEENKFYQYDFFFNNCTTRLRDLLLLLKKPNMDLPPVLPSNTTFRNAIHNYLDRGNQPWSKLGIDILLGAKTDRIMSAKDQEFLPDNLMNALDASNQPVVLEKKNLLPAQPIASDSNNTSPIQLTTRLLFIAFILGLIKNKYSQRGMIIFDKFFFTVVGLLGILLVFMWIGTDHSMTKNNYNLAWALPSFIVIPWLLKKQNDSVYTFIALHRYILAFMLLGWTILPQQMNPALLPVVLLLFIRLLSYRKR
jgi:hypothetical protein